MGQLAELIKAKRYDLRLSQKAFGDRLGLQNGSSYISRIEKGLIVPSRVRLHEMEQAFSFFPGELEDAAFSDEQARNKAG
ncbi:multiprotein-bridging factor 1 family protein [Deinococcus wulumuqiensis]|nr:helix-turn-helix transcriptional regulator [Deinococcus wulumuqiensis]QII20003.1 helix-turn-helix transcriptional regulator [Deinococcus wulumuqiensis R12]